MNADHYSLDQADSWCLGYHNQELVVFDEIQGNIVPAGEHLTHYLKDNEQESRRVAYQKQQDELIDLQKQEQKLYRFFIIRLFLAPWLWILTFRRRSKQQQQRRSGQHLAGHTRLLSFRMDEKTCKAFEQCAIAFNQLQESMDLWWLETHEEEHHFDKMQPLMGPKRLEAQLFLDSHPALDARGLAMSIQSGNKTCYIYPFFMVLEEQGQPPHFLDLEKFTLLAQEVIWLEDEEEPPRDGQIISHGDVWVMDKGNETLQSRPFVRYQSLQWEWPGSLKTAFAISNTKLAKEFIQALKNYFRQVQELRKGHFSQDLTDYEGNSPPTFTSLTAAPVPATKFYGFPYLDLGLLAIAAGLWILIAGNHPFWQSLKQAGFPFSETVQSQQAEEPAIALEELGTVSQTEEEPTVLSIPPDDLRQRLEMNDNLATVPDLALFFVEVVVGLANIRNAPDLRSDIIEKAERGRNFRVYDKTPDWVLVGDDEPLGWIAANLVGPARDGQP